MYKAPEFSMYKIRRQVYDGKQSLDTEATVTLKEVVNPNPSRRWYKPWVKKYIRRLVTKDGEIIFEEESNDPL